VIALLFAFGAREPSREGQPFAPSEALSELLSAVGEDGEAIIAAEDRAYFDGLPGRAKEFFEEAVESELMSAPAHLEEILALGLPAGKLELLMRDNCALCHTDPSEQDPETLFSVDPEANESPPHLNLRGFVGDVHFRRGLSCAGCHGGDPADGDMADEIYERWPEAPERHEDRTWIPEFCARCHADPAFMRNFDPGLPTDQYAKYEASLHGSLLLVERDSKAAQCVSCHGAHSIRGSRSPQSSVHPQRVPYTCGTCHADAEYMAGYLGPDGEPLPTDQLEEYESSVHGLALFERGDLGAPACNDCHGNHAAMPPEVSSTAQVCRSCHAGNGELFDGSKHKEAFERNGWPECAQCHGNHAIDPADDSMLSEESNPLCYECHREHARDNPDCEATAEYFYDSITAVADETSSLQELVPVLAERGLDVESLDATLDELEDILMRSRSQIHAFDRSEFDELATLGSEGAKRGWQLVSEADAEYRFRRNGLIVSIGLMAFVVLMVYLKLREIERG
jgi:predicted CXXCH cytochrome family protein